MTRLKDVHGDGSDERYVEHTHCPDLHCCACECRACKRAWFAADRPHPDDCPTHGKHAERPTAWARVLSQR